MKKKYFILVLFFAIFISDSFSQNQKSSKIIFILDCSGSMWQKIKEETRISIAKRVMKNLINKLPDDTKAGLIVYGHRNKSDCEDIETLVSFSSLNKNLFNLKIDAIDPKGKTPIAKSIQHSLQIIKNENQMVNVVLISDGLETCEGNACDLVKKEKEQGSKIVVHVIGFGLDENNLSQLECIAQAGGGQYVPANNADELLAALETTIQPTLVDGGYLSIKASHGGKPMDALIKVFKKDDVKEISRGRTYTSKETNPRVLLLPEGQYKVEIASITLDGRPVQTLDNVVISKRNTLNKELDFSSGTIEIKVNRNGILSDATIQIFRKGENKTTVQGRSYTNSNSNPVKYQILPGIYDLKIGSIEIAGKPVKLIENQSIGSGQIVNIEHNFESGEIKIGAKQGSNFVDATISIYKNGQNVTSGKTYSTANTNPKSFVLEPGKYKIDLKPVNSKNLSPKSIEVELKVKDSIESIVVW